MFRYHREMVHMDSRKLHLWAMGCFSIVEDKDKSSFQMVPKGNGCRKNLKDCIAYYQFVYGKMRSCRERLDQDTWASWPD